MGATQQVGPMRLIGLKLYLNDLIVEGDLNDLIGYAFLDGYIDGQRQEPAYLRVRPNPNSLH